MVGRVLLSTSSMLGSLSHLTFLFERFWNHHMLMHHIWQSRGGFMNLGFSLNLNFCGHVYVGTYLSFGLIIPLLLELLLLMPFFLTPQYQCSSFSKILLKWLIQYRKFLCFSLDLKFIFLLLATILWIVSFFCSWLLMIFIRLVVLILESRVPPE